MNRKMMICFRNESLASGMNALFALCRSAFVIVLISVSVRHVALIGHQIFDGISVQELNVVDLAVHRDTTIMSETANMYLCHSGISSVDLAALSFELCGGTHRNDFK